MEPADVARAWEANAETWTHHARRGLDVYRDALNTPAFLAMLPPVNDLLGLDIGCGEGFNTRQLARHGARMRAVDIAPTFVRHAQETEAADPLGIAFTVGYGMALPFDDGGFDFATAFMSLMDMPDPGQALREAARALRPGGFLQFSILHPCFMPPHRKVLRDEDGAVRAIEVGGYHDRIDGREDTWWFSTLPKAERAEAAPFRTPRFHRTLSEWIAMIVAAGLVVEAMGEPRADPELARSEPVVADTAVVPLFLHVRARKAIAPPSMSLDHAQLAMPPKGEPEARAFYAGLLGLTEVPKPANLATRGGCWFVGGAAKLHLGVERDFAPARKAHPALLVPNLAELVGRLEAAGHACRTDEPLNGYARRYVDDPFGNRIELMQSVEPE
jgi:SAM-dependent methyltransferase/catechol 2,3-dioxygenase-like lactoylglutathione lyase family enzyme